MAGWRAAEVQGLWYLGYMEETVPLKPVKQEQSRKLQRIPELREVSQRSQFQLFGLRFKLVSKLCSLRMKYRLQPNCMFWIL